jgi:hypothetical protein
MGDTTFLFARPSFLEGLARSIDLGATLDEYNQSVTPEQADLIAIRNDWEMVGEDIFVSLQNEGEKLKKMGKQIEFDFVQE